MSEVKTPALPMLPQGRKRWIVFLVAGLLLLLCGLLIFLFFQKKVEQSQFAMVDGMVYTVSAEITGPILDIAVSEGGKVNKGQVVAHMDVRSYTEEVEAASKDIAALRSPTMEEINKRLRGAEASEDDAIARLASIRHEEEAKRLQMESAVLAHVQSELAMRSLAASSGIHTPEYKQAVDKEKKTRKHMEQMQESYEKSSRLRAALSQELDRIRYEVQEAKRIASINRYRAQPVVTEGKKRSQPAVNPNVTTPVAGTVLKISAKPGDRVEQGDPLLLVIPDGQENALWIKAWFPLSIKDSVRLGLPCTIERVSDKRYAEGVIEAILPPEQLPKSQGQEGLDFLPVRVRLTSSIGLMPGEAVYCSITTSFF